MADILPLNFPIPSESNIASYDWVDLAEGTGMVLLYGFVTEDSSGLDYRLSRTQFYSKEIEYAIGSSTNIDLDFDLTEFNYPTTIGGTGIISFYGGGGHSAAGQSSKLTWTIKVRKWDGASETDIATATSDTLDINQQMPSTSEDHFIVPITIPETSFKVGETLRLSFSSAVTDGPAAGDFSVVLGTDPQNRDGTYLTPSGDSENIFTWIKFYCPFKINL